MVNVPHFFAGICSDMCFEIRIISCIQYYRWSRMTVFKETDVFLSNYETK